MQRKIVYRVHMIYLYADREKEGEIGEAKPDS